ncbi:hypothetical protein OZX62_05280 [Bifidobacterium sp. ESL0690]|uniref:hypothetical protein n=1 Tax=Bifidobacterium sp. ESL0690 TaxID=2983214 RepID=UPI0023F9960F|nr:hypothetical protein [Bifidobacterium sp. ESL0690]WEV47672.1 hypothetical protein OZX62_05280 [Bifidobacterium sp. ESL0690]
MKNVATSNKSQQGNPNKLKEGQPVKPSFDITGFPNDKVQLAYYSNAESQQYLRVSDIIPKADYVTKALSFKKLNNFRIKFNGGLDQKKLQSDIRDLGGTPDRTAVGALVINWLHKNGYSGEASVVTNGKDVLKGEDVIDINVNVSTGKHNGSMLIIIPKNGISITLFYYGSEDKIDKFICNANTNIPTGIESQKIIDQMFTN